MVNLVLCMDGTWNDKEDGSKSLTNIAKIFNLAVEGTNQRKEYVEGVGNRGPKVAQIFDGGFAGSLDGDIEEGYRWLAENYNDGDDIYIFGFSRGSYTARSLVGMINKVGLVDFTNTTLWESRKKQRVREEFSNYRTRGETTKTLQDVPVNKNVKIHFLGVFDTVGSLGIPDEVSILKTISTHGQFLFHDTKLGNTVTFARHAMGMDERRRTFIPTHWSNKPEGVDLKQVFFPGVHSNIGGGYPDTQLSDITFRWMITDAIKAGLKLKDGWDDDLKDNPHGKLEDSVSGFFKPLKTRPRYVPNILSSENDDVVHKSARERQTTPPDSSSSYWPTKTLQVGESATVDIPAKLHWAPTGLFLEAGCKYKFEAKGKWKDLFSSCGPEGFKEGGRNLGRRLGDFYGSYEDRKSGDREGYQPSTFSPNRRYPKKARWFELMGTIASGHGVSEVSKNPIAHQTFAIGDGSERDDVSPDGEGGYLYCFANDAWAFYWNNSKSVQLTVTRTA